MSDLTAELRLAFGAAHYLIYPAAGEALWDAASLRSLIELRAAGWIDTRTGQTSPALASVLCQRGVTQAQLLTPCNPRGLRTNDDANHRALKTMAEMLIQQAQSWLSALSMDTMGEWREPGFLLLGASPEQGLTWAQTFDQAAWVEYDAAGRGKLRWTADRIERGDASVSTES